MNTSNSLITDAKCSAVIQNIVIKGIAVPLHRFCRSTKYMLLAWGVKWSDHRIWYVTRLVKAVFFRVGTICNWGEQSITNGHWPSTPIIEWSMQTPQTQTPYNYGLLVLYCFLSNNNLNGSLSGSSSQGKLLNQKQTNILLTYHNFLLLGAPC